jgi:parvulin-like peptidyl-prolyl isomerase
MSKSIDLLLDNKQITVTPDEVKEEAAKFRKMNGLIAESQLAPFLASRRVTNDEFMQYFERVAKLNKLKMATISEKELEQQFALRKSELDRAEIYRIVVTKESRAKALKAEIQDGASFFSLAKEQSEDRTAKQCGYSGFVGRRDLRPEIEAAVFAATAGSILGPIKSAGQYHIILVEQMVKATFEEKTLSVLRDEIFQKWLQEQL